MEMSKNDRFLIYGLADPDTGMVRYVGQSSRGMERPKAHTTPTNVARARNHCGNWIRALAAAGKKPRIVVLEAVARREDLSDAERKWIARGRAEGWPLTNQLDGGQGYHVVSELARAKIAAALARLDPDAQATRSARMSEAQRRRFASPEARAEASAKNLGFKHTPAAKAKIGDASRNASTETRAKWSAARTGRKHSAETLAKMRATARNRSPERKAEIAAVFLAATQRRRARKADPGTQTPPP